MELKNYVAQWAGEVLPGATCYLYQAGTETLASGLQDAAGATLDNPFQAGSDGLIQFAAPNGVYDLRVMSGGRDSRMRVQCLDVAEQLAAAQVEADRAGTEADRAGSEAERAEAARDAAMANSKIYPDTAAGLAEVADSQYFSVPSAESSEYLILYKNNAGSAVEVKRYPSASAVSDLAGQSAQVAADLDVMQQRVAPYKTKAADIGGVEPLASFAAPDELGRLYNLLSFMPDGSILSTPLHDFVLARLAGISFSTIEAAGWGSYVFAQRGGDGALYALSGLREDGSAYPAAASQSALGEVLHIPFHGQSNAAGDDSKPPVSTLSTGWGSYMFARGVATWSGTDNANTPEGRAAEGFSFTDLRAGSVETRANAMADAFIARLVGASRFSPELPSNGPRVLISFAGLGGRKLTELGPENDGASGRPGARAPGGHWPTMLDDIARGKATAAAAGLGYSVPAWVYDQGESEGDMTLYYGGDTLAPSSIISGYATKALTMAQAFDSSVRGITGQSRPIPLFVTPATYNQLTPTAWMDVADASPLVFLVGARYQMPSAKNASNGLSGASQNWGNEIHYSPDGQRWIGEMCAKVMHRVLHEGEDWQPLRVLSAVKVDANRIDLKFHIPRPPMVIDTDFLPKAQGWGISICAGTVDAYTGARQVPTAVEILPDGRTLRATFASIPTGALLRIGASICDLGAAMTVSAVGTGSPTAHGFETHTVSISGDVRAALKGLADEGAFWADAALPNGAVTSMCVIRSVTFDGSSTVLTGEVRERRSDGSYGPFQVGDILRFRRMNPYTNFRDSDNAMALNTFASGPRTGKLYPLHNWACQYEGMSVQGA